MALGALLGGERVALTKPAHLGLPALLLRFAGTRGATGRWYTAVLRPAATASMVSSSREDMRYRGTCYTGRRVLSAGRLPSGCPRHPLCPTWEPWRVSSAPATARLTVEAGRPRPGSSGPATESFPRAQQGPGGPPEKQVQGENTE